MSGCTDKKLGRLLHDYELGMLPEEDKKRFEMHLYECDNCLALAREFMDVSRIIRNDPDASAIVEELASEASDTERHRTRKKLSPYTKLLIAAVIMVVLAVPIHRYWLQTDEVSVVQTLELLPTRTGGDDIICLEQGGDVTISFFVGQEFREMADVVISEVEGDTLLFRSGFSDFNEQGLGSVTLSVSEFSEGHYILTVRPSTDNSVLHETRYTFRVK